MKRRVRVEIEFEDEDRLAEDEDEEGVISEASEKEAKAKENLAGLRGFLDL